MPRPCRNCRREVQLNDYERESLATEANRLLYGVDEACGYAEQHTRCRICNIYLEHGDPIINGPTHADCFLAYNHSSVRVRWISGGGAAPTPPVPPPAPPQRNWVLELFGPDLRPKPVILRVEEINPHTLVREDHRHSFETEQDAYDFVTHNYIGNTGTAGTLFQERTLTVGRMTFRLEEAERE